MSALRKVLDGVRRIREAELGGLSLSLEESRILSAKLLAAQLRSCGSPARLRDAEFKVFSQIIRATERVGAR